MSKTWLESLTSHLPESVEHAIEDADRAIHEFKQNARASHWRPISTAPHNQELELRIGEGSEVEALEFPCLQTNSGAWINVDLGAEIKIQPVEWRLWRREKSPEPHHAQIKASDRSALFHRSSVRRVADGFEGDE
jgi:hypothetical protein